MIAYKNNIEGMMMIRVNEEMKKDENQESNRFINFSVNDEIIKQNLKN